MKKKLVYILICFCFLHVYAENGRIIVSLNENWKFRQIYGGAEIGNDTTININLPHCWGIKEAIDDKPGYSRGTGIYKKDFFIPTDYSTRELFLCFEGVNQVAEVYVNGKYVGKHLGGYTRFYMDVTHVVSTGHINQLEVKVNNLYSAAIPPLSADFTFFGGIHRDVYLVSTNKTHFEFVNGSTGVLINSTLQNSEAVVHVKGSFSSERSKSNPVKVEAIIESATDSKIVQKSTDVIFSGQHKLAFNLDLSFNNPTKWSPGNPYLYKVIVRLIDAHSGEVLDEQIQPLGIRTYYFDPDKGFFLNGNKLKLIGVNRHQSFESKGFALDDAININDVRMIKEMGANFLRISHYPQDPVILDMCDKLGIICSVEIPLVNEISESREFTENTLSMTREMIYQDFNHPSVMLWAYMNEIFLVQPFKNNPERNKIYQHSVLKLAELIQNEIRKLDPARPTMIPCHGDLNLYTETGITNVPDIVGWNLYQGWYVGEMTDFEKFLKDAKQSVPSKPIIVSEYGADTDMRLHSFCPQRFDYSNEYAVELHRHYLDQIMKTDFVAGAAIWNFNDFYSESRINAIPHVNSKGLVTLNREIKDIYRFYKVALSQTPQALFASNWTVRSGTLQHNQQCMQLVRVFANTDSVQLKLNQKNFETKPVVNFVSEFNVPFVNGTNQLDIYHDGKLYDSQKVEFKAVPFLLNDSVTRFMELNVMLGSNRYFEDKTRSITWIPEQPYKSGSWGYIGGISYSKKTRNFIMPVTDADILNTTDEPLFQSQREGIEGFKMDVPDGEYVVEFFWAELKTDKERAKLANELGNESISEKTGKRVFDVVINGEKVIEDLNLAKEYGMQTAMSKKVLIEVNKGNGIDIHFVSKSGVAVLNAIRIIKLN